MGYGVTLMRHKVKFTGKPKSQNYLFLAQIELPYVKWWKRQFYQEMSIPRRIKHADHFTQFHYHKVI